MPKTYQTLNNIFISGLSHTFPLENIHDKTSLPWLNQGGHVNNIHCASFLMYHGNNYSPKDHVGHDCHSRHPPKSAPCKKFNIENDSKHMNVFSPKASLLSHIMKGKTERLFIYSLTLF